jgi:hypothetical protein
MWSRLLQLLTLRALSLDRQMTDSNYQTLRIKKLDGLEQGASGHLLAHVRGWPIVLRYQISFAQNFAPN